MDTLPPRSPEARERQLRRGGSGSRRNTSGNLREDIELITNPDIYHLPTPRTADGMRAPLRPGITNPRGRLEDALAMQLLPTIVATEGTKASDAMTSAQRRATGQVYLTNVIQDVVRRLLPTTRAAQGETRNHHIYERQNGTQNLENVVISSGARALNGDSTKTLSADGNESWAGQLPGQLSLWDETTGNA